MNKPICKLALLTSTGSALSVYLESTRKGVYRLPHAIYICTTVASPCQTLRELLAGATSNGILKTQPSVSGTAHAQFAETFHFSAFHL